MNQTAIVAGVLAPTLTDSQFLDMLAQDVEILDTTPADALKGTVREMSSLETRRYTILPSAVVATGHDEAIVGPEDFSFFHGYE